MEYRDFLEIVQKKRSKKNFKVSGSWGVHDALNYIRKNKWFNIGKPLKESEFYSIIRNINDLLAENFTNGNEIYFPQGMGKLELRKIEKGVFFNNKGKLVNTYPIDWDATLKLWYNNDEAKDNKVLVRRATKYDYKIHYNKHNAHYKNQIYYDFVPNRFMQRALKENIIKGKIDTLW